ncbi:DUF1816 domain-containing protein [Acaryochloris marina]|uniref:Uncharacterized protein n=1 Tax=Acaryochloris marina (strain MBIC 11017) TaxID=329726 RepID=A8ZLX7_ACAM1|nr:DUF1816 domain-containing protein [Acaryochloris marina]ABW31746.1 hypothetical protein AM1_B0020 [Acaryochloris marina MBIC11017]BDM83052.1 hypothetical protein AM10699_59130 [Acaryochloris marina MBIC10699]
MIKKMSPNNFNTRASKTSDKNDNLCSGWWLEVGTANPPCIDFYGPFEGKAEAEVAKLEYVQKSTKTSQIVFSHSKFCQPRQRTLTQNDFTIQDLKDCPPTFFKVVLGGHRIY